MTVSGQDWIADALRLARRRNCASTRTRNSAGRQPVPPATITTLLAPAPPRPLLAQPRPPRPLLALTHHPVLC